MKYLLFTTLLLILTLTNLFSQEWKVVDRRFNFEEGFISSHYFYIKCADSNNCIILCYLSGAGGYYLRRTTDGGQTWKNVYMDSAYYRSDADFKYVPEISSIAYPNEKLFIAVGDSGLVLRSTDKGETWERYSFGNDIELHHLSMVDESYGITAYSHYSVFNKCGFLETTDGGLTWKDINWSPNFVNISSYSQINKNLMIGFAEFQDTTIKGRYIIFAHNSWKSFDTVRIPDTLAYYYLDGKKHYLLYKMCFISENEGWLSGGHRNNNNIQTNTQLIVHTTDAGKTWEIQRNGHYNNETIKDINFFDNQLGVATSGEGMNVMTTNGGKEWEEVIFEKYDPMSGRFCYSYCPEVASPTTAYVIYDFDSVYKYQRYPTDVKELPTENNPLCKVTLETNNSQNEFTINLDCEHKGTISFKLYDLLGNVVYIKDVYKNSNLLTVPISSMFRSGVYFLSVTLDDKFLYYNKIVITN